MARLAGAAAVCVASLGGTACGGQTRSAAAFCGVVDQYSAEFKALGDEIQTRNNANDPLSALAIAFGSLGEVEKFVGDLAHVAPDPVRSDVEIVNGDVQYGIDNAGSAVTGLGGALNVLFRTLAHENSYRRIDDYAAANCGKTIFAPRGSAAG